MRAPIEVRVVTVKPGRGREWQVSFDGQNTALLFTARHLAIDFARAYVTLRLATTLQIFNASGILEREENLGLSAPPAENTKG
jgi:hypothetical protein